MAFLERAIQGSLCRSEHDVQEGAEAHTKNKGDLLARLNAVSSELNDGEFEFAVDQVNILSKKQTLTSAVQHQKSKMLAALVQLIALKFT